MAHGWMVGGDRMRRTHAMLPGALIGGLVVAASAYAQAPEQPATPAPAVANMASPPVPAATASPAPAPKTYTVPAGTKVLLQLRSSVNTKSARAGDGVYLASIFPVTVGSRVMIPEGVYVQGRRSGPASRSREREGPARYALYLDDLSQRHRRGDSGHGRFAAGREEADHQRR